ncbi:MAG: four-helix bundle copper-binding protein [Longimicrobiales bacterium]
MQHLEKILDAHPDPAHADGAVALACIRACFDCSATCATCADACLAEDDVAGMVHCVRLNLDCVDVCDVTGRLIARPSARDANTLREQLEACVAACRACGDECAKHGQHGVEHCRVCAHACQACAKACEEMAGALVA